MLCSDHSRKIQCDVLGLQTKKKTFNRTNRLPVSDKRGLDLGWYRKISANSQTHVHCVRKST